MLLLDPFPLSVILQFAPPAIVFSSDCAGLADKKKRKKRDKSKPTEPPSSLYVVSRHSTRKPDHRTFPDSKSHILLQHTKLSSSAVAPSASNSSDRPISRIFSANSSFS
ncbi:hypothetical protein S83_065759 [Arachis hypogaea]